MGLNETDTFTRQGARESPDDARIVAGTFVECDRRDVVCGDPLGSGSDRGETNDHGAKTTAIKVIDDSRHAAFKSTKLKRGDNKRDGDAASIPYAKGLGCAPTRQRRLKN